MFLLVKCCIPVMDLLFAINIDFKMLRRMEVIMFHFVISLITIATDCNQKQELGFNCWIKKDNGNGGGGGRTTFGCVSGKDKTEEIQHCWQNKTFWSPSETLWLCFFQCSWYCALWRIAAVPTFYQFPWLNNILHSLLLPLPSPSTFF